MNHNYKSLAEFIRQYDYQTRTAIYNVLRRAPEYGFMDSPNEKKIKALIEEKENGRTEKEL